MQYVDLHCVFLFFIIIISLLYLFSFYCYFEFNFNARQIPKEDKDEIIPHRTRRVARPSPAAGMNAEDIPETPAISTSSNGIIKYPRTGKRGAPQVLCKA
jgi:hypothetical protein